MGKEKSEIINQLKSFKKSINAKHKIDRMILFGSVPKGTATSESDIDVILVSDEFEGKSSLKRPVQFYLEWPFRIPVDFICFTKHEFEKLKKQVSIVSEALATGIEI
jgi:predicted nucleotidyltransferase